jgi:hypothetical protein
VSDLSLRNLIQAVTAGGLVELRIDRAYHPRGHDPQ